MAVELPAWLPPEWADAMRDARALVKSCLDDDDEGTRAILAALEDDSQHAAMAAHILAGMVIELLKHSRRHWLARFIDQGRC